MQHEEELEILVELLDDEDDYSLEDTIYYFNHIYTELHEIKWFI